MIEEAYFMYRKHFFPPIKSDLTCIIERSTEHNILFYADGLRLEHLKYVTDPAECYRIG